MNIWHPHEHKLLNPRFIAFGLSFRLHFQQQFISPSFWTMRFLHSVAVLLSPGFAHDGTQSTFHLSHSIIPQIVFEDFVRKVVSAYHAYELTKSPFFALTLYNFRHPTKSKILSLRFFVRTIKN